MANSLWVSHNKQHKKDLCSNLKQINKNALTIYGFFTLVAYGLSLNVISLIFSNIWLLANIALIYLFYHSKMNLIYNYKNDKSLDNELMTLFVIVIFSAILWSLLISYTIILKYWDVALLSIALAIFVTYQLSVIDRMAMAFVYPLLIPIALTLFIDNHQEYFIYGLYTLVYLYFIFLIERKLATYPDPLLNIESIKEPVILTDEKNNEFKPEIESKAQQSSLRKVKFNNLSETNILIVEDNEVNQKLIQNGLSNLCKKVYIVNNGLEAVKLLPSISVDCIVMDVQMPVMDGHEATQIIRNMDKYKDTPIIIVTANTYLSHRDECIEIGASDFLNKPVEIHVLINTIKYWLRIPPKTDLSEEAYIEITNEIYDQTFNPIEARKFFLNKNIYVDTLNLFINNQSNVVDKLNDALSNHKVDQFKRLIHTLKGLSLQIGAKTLHEHAKKIDLQLKNELAEYSELTNDLHELEQEHLKVIQTVQSYIDKNSNQLQNQTPKKSKSRTLDNDKLNNEIDEVIGLIINFDTHSVEKLKQVLSNYEIEADLESKLKNILTLLQQFDYEKAIEVYNNDQCFTSK
ncbi:MAG: response regulator [Gammaproteobacteria bacterium]|nr:response regulator [Gammaproteobacteria bacterium]